MDASQVSGTRSRSSRPPQIEALTGVRAIAATWVLLYHFLPVASELVPGLRALDPIARTGFLGVEMFFVLSGFVIAYNYAGSITNGRSCASYLRARLARLYPVHAFTILVTAAMVIAAKSVGFAVTADRDYSVSQYAGNLLMLQAFPGFTNVNGTSWSISCESAAYVLFALCGWLVLRLPSSYALVLGFAILAGESVAVQVFAHPATFDPTSCRMIWLRISCEFTAGVALWGWWRSRAATFRGRDGLAALSLATILGGSFLVGWDSPRAYLTLPLFGLFVLGVASSRGYVKRALSGRLMQWGGRISYSLYMTHYLFYIAAEQVGLWQMFAASTLIVRTSILLAFGLAVLLTAALTYHCIEEPCRRLLQRIPSGSGSGPAGRPAAALAR